MQVKIWLIALPFVCLTGGALAQSAPAPAETAAPAEKAASPAKPHARQRQGGDIRGCLDKKDNKAIIRCSEQGQKPAHRRARKHAAAAKPAPQAEAAPKADATPKIELAPKSEPAAKPAPKVEPAAKPAPKP